VFDVSSQELLLLGAVAIAVIPPKDLPRAMRFAGQWIGKARGMARHFRSGLDEMIRQAELEEIEKKWREENERIMREHPLHDAIEHPEEPVMTALPSPEAPVYAPIDEPPVGPAPVAETASDLAPAMPEGGPSPAVRVERREEETGPELPLGLPPKS
jgi:sec-independent protein translocase protein TatB